MLAKVFSGSVLGVDPYLVEIEVDISSGLPAMIVVGLPDESVKESRDRVKAALHNCGFTFPARRITVNLAPADVRKEGVCFDLPIAVGILAASGQIPAGTIGEYLFMGELALDGTVRPVRGCLPVALGMRRWDRRKVMVPFENVDETAVVDGVEAYPLRTLGDAVGAIRGEGAIAPVRFDGSSAAGETPHDDDFADVKGQEHVKRALEVAAAGGHNVLMIGPPGSGKTMLARRLPTIIPDMTPEESIETTAVHSVAGLLRGRTGLVRERPFRAPHHSISSAGLVGGGTYPLPGEVSMSHNGVLFLDELPEFRRDALESLRQPLEDRTVHISRARRSVSFPSRFMLVCSMNPCPCGYHTDRARACRCTPAQIQRYMSKISGPLLDRIDIHVEVPSVSYKALTAEAPSESSRAIKRRVDGARLLQRERFSNERVVCNALMKSRHIKKHCRLEPEAHALLARAQEQLGMSARGYDKILKVARTVADLAGSDRVQTEHVAEAVQYRALDRERAVV